MTDYRHEWKHVITPVHRQILRQRLRVVAQPDGYAVDGRYHICSLYFDDLNDTALREKLDGVSRREKYRLRCYNLDFGLIHLEKKSKLAGLGRKESCSVTQSEVQALLAGQLDWMAADPRPLVGELYAKLRTGELRPKTLVEYVREPFVFAPGNVRVTLDYDIRTGLNSTGFLDPHCPTVPVKDGPILLEVKWDAFLPDVIRDAVQLDGVRTSSFSKYAACRMYD